MMKKIIFTSIFLFGFLATFAQNAPVISFEKTTFEYGKIYQNGDGNCEFVFTNTGKEPLVLSQVQASCGCTTPKWPREPIMPGQSKSIKVKYDTRRIGKFNKRITIQSNAEPAVVYLNIVGEVLKKPSEAIPEKNVSVGATPLN